MDNALLGKRMIAGENDVVGRSQQGMLAEAVFNLFGNRADGGCKINLVGKQGLNRVAGVFFSGKDLNSRVFLPKLDNDIRKEHVQNDSGNAHSDCAAVRRADSGIHIVQEIVIELQKIHRCFIKILSRIGQLKSLGISSEKRGFEIILQQHDAFGKGGLRNMKLGGGFIKFTALHKGDIIPDKGNVDVFHFAVSLTRNRQEAGLGQHRVLLCFTIYTLLKQLSIL
ncbi:hypothetical protein SDC9_119141 [bioreactor metagenome]|uniref:Uncharacterized protein n=1 Tax=bioreactor metagenome TaxID=1076179 RepID=A0A645C468_9ZZZZ